MLSAVIGGGAESRPAPEAVLMTDGSALSKEPLVRRFTAGIAAEEVVARGPATERIVVCDGDSGGRGPIPPSIVG